MKFISFIKDGRSSYGLVEGGRIRDLGADRDLGCPDIVSLLSSGRLREAQSGGEAGVHAVEDVEFLPVVPNPGKILCIGLNYESHRLETGRAKEEYPVVFTRFADSQIGHLKPIIRPAAVSTAFDFEGEIALVIGKGGYRIDRSEALAHVAGYACYNDVSVRDWQRHTHQFTAGKNFPGTAPFGPYLVTADEAGDFASLRLTTRLNGEVVQDARGDDLIFSVPELISYCSSFTRLAPGDVIVTGTPGGVGAQRKPPLFMAPGDVVEVEVSGLGTLRNSVVDEDPTTGSTNVIK